MSKKEDMIPKSSYSTGDTNPTKNHGGILVLVLAGVILLGSIISLTGFLNIDTGAGESEPAVIFSHEESATEAQRLGDTTPMLGIRCETVTIFMQRYYRLPNGVYVTQLLEKGAAQDAGVQPGDVITAMDGEPVFSAKALLGAVRNRQVGDRVQLSVVRQGAVLSISLILGSEESK